MKSVNGELHLIIWDQLINKVVHIVNSQVKIIQAERQWRVQVDNLIENQIGNQLYRQVKANVKL
jgi:hypothetical protein